MLILFMISLAIMVGGIFIVTFVVRDRSFDTCVDSATRERPKGPANKVKIGIIGDSWVAGKELDKTVLDALSVAGLQAEIVSSGQPGAVSRQVYRNLTAKDIAAYSSRHILMDADIDYLIVVAGINDTVEHMGRNFYAHHMQCIIKAAQAQGLNPIILEIPEYGIRITPPKSFLNYSKRLIYRIIFDGNVHDVILSYRKALIEDIPPEMMKNMSLVAFSPLSENYYESLELYENPNHLNKKGYQKLGEMISGAIIELHNT